jgi:hypothetical protein
VRRIFPKFDKLWTDCTQEESRLISKSHKTNYDENQELVYQVKKRKEREEDNLKKKRSIRDHVTRRMHQISYATTARIWDIMPHNILLNMKRERRSIMHM